MGKLRNILILAVILGGIVGLVAVGPGVGSRAVPAPILPSIIPSPTASPKGTATVESSDGSKVLTMKMEKTDEGTVNTFLVSNQTLFTKNTPLGTVLSVPANAFSPDNKYFFFKSEGGGVITYFVSSMSGEPVEFSSLFAAKYPNYRITDVTGWGGQNLILINTDKIEGGTGPSIWFDVKNSTFIQLSTRFN